MDYDTEVVADSEGEDAYNPTGESLADITAAVIAARQIADAKVASRASSIQTGTFTDTRSHVVSKSTISSFTHNSKSPPHTIQPPISRPRPRPAFKGPSAAESIESNIGNSIATSAITHSRSRTHSSLIGSFSSEVIELTSDEDELALRSPKVKAKTNSKSTSKSASKSFPPLTVSPQRPLPTSFHNQPVSDSLLSPPLPSTMSAPTTTDHPPIAFLPNPDTSPPPAPLRKRKRMERDFGMELDSSFDALAMPPPPRPEPPSSFFAGSSSPASIPAFDVSVDDSGIDIPSESVSKKSKSKEAKSLKTKTPKPRKEKASKSTTTDPKPRKKKKTTKAVIETSPKYKSREFVSDDEDGDDELGLVGGDKGIGLTLSKSPAKISMDGVGEDGETDVVMDDKAVDVEAAKKKNGKMSKRKVLLDEDEDKETIQGKAKSGRVASDDEIQDGMNVKKRKKRRTVVCSDDDAHDDDIPVEERVIVVKNGRGKKRAGKKETEKEKPTESSQRQKEREEKKVQSDEIVAGDVVEETAKENFHSPKVRKENTSLSSKLSHRSYTIGSRSTSTPMSELIRRVSLPNSDSRSPSTPTPTSYSPYLKSSRSLLSKIAPLHPNRRTPPPALPPPPKKAKTKKELMLEEKWEEELSENVEGWAVLTDEERRDLRKAKRELELGGYED